jgi:hypothetical protein
MKSSDSESPSDPPYILPAISCLSKSQKKIVEAKVRAIGSEVSIYVAIMKRTSFDVSHNKMLVVNCDTSKGPPHGRKPQLLIPAPGDLGGDSTSPASAPPPPSPPCRRRRGWSGTRAGPKDGGGEAFFYLDGRASRAAERHGGPRRHQRQQGATNPGPPRPDLATPRPDLHRATVGAPRAVTTYGWQHHLQGRDSRVPWPGLGPPWSDLRRAATGAPTQAAAAAVRRDSGPSAWW